MSKIFGKILMVCFIINLVGCASNTQGENTSVGAAAGAVVGGVAGGVVSGGKAIGVGIGAVAGALLGGVIGHSMDSSDQNHVYKSVSTGKKTTWVDSKNNTTYTVVPSNHYTTIKGNHHCRKFMVISNHNGQMKKVYGAACMQNGSWHTVK